MHKSHSSNEIISVTELNESAKYLLENTFSDVAVIGEISNLAVIHTSGHMYFTLKDEKGSIRCAMWKNYVSGLNFKPKDGDKCVIKGKVSLFSARGEYQIQAVSIELAGIGNLMQKYEKLKIKLANLGLFDENKKIEMPKYPKHIGIITSSSTAAFQDIRTTIERRAPSSQVSLSKCSVQGDVAAKSIISAIDRIELFNSKNKSNPIDLIIICRGGGSIEDLWCFNDEKLAYKISALSIPVISGIGHEIDFTITDFVSDKRAPTPTAAAELATQGIFNLNQMLFETNNHMIKTIKNSLKNKKNLVELVNLKLKDPASFIKELIQKVDNYELIFISNIKNKYLNCKKDLSNINHKIKENSPKTLLKNKMHKVAQTSQILISMYQKYISQKKYQLESIESNINTLNPLSILKRGYSVITNKYGKIIKSYKDVNDKEMVSARLGKGTIDLEVKK